MAYAASKGALNTLTLSLAPQVRVNAIAPGFVDGGLPSRVPEKVQYAQVLAAQTAGAGAGAARRGGGAGLVFNNPGTSHDGHGRDDRQRPALVDLSHDDKDCSTRQCGKVPALDLLTIDLLVKARLSTPSFFWKNICLT